VSFPRTLAALLSAQGLRQTANLSFALPASSERIEWQLTFRALGFTKNQIDGALRHRHVLATDFAWSSLARFGGERWKASLANHTDRLSGGLALGPLLGWRSDHTFETRGLSPDETAARVAEDVRARVLPFAARIHDDPALLAHLCHDEEPNPWYRSQGLLRLAEIAKLEAILGIESSHVPELTERFQVMLQDQLDDVPLQSYVNNVLGAASDA